MVAFTLRAPFDSQRRRFCVDLSHAADDVVPGVLREHAGSCPRRPNASASRGSARSARQRRRELIDVAGPDQQTVAIVAHQFALGRRCAPPPPACRRARPRGSRGRASRPATAPPSPRTRDTTPTSRLRRRRRGTRCDCDARDLVDRPRGRRSEEVRGVVAPTTTEDRLTRPLRSRRRGIASIKVSMPLPSP